jgi:hypothetical protein
MNYIFFALIFLHSFLYFGQSDSSKALKYTLHGGVDSYYQYQLKKNSGEVPFYVSSSKNGVPAINLAWLDQTLVYNRMELKASVGLGDYVSYNYKLEKLKFPIETYIKAQPFKAIPFTITYGVLVAPFSYETAMSKDQVMYIRSLAAENAPYYLYGAKLSYDLSKRCRIHGYIINGWQEIKNYNKKLAGTLQLEYNSSDKTTANMNVYVADESGSITNPFIKNRIFVDASIKHDFSTRLLVQSAVSLGSQSYVNTSNLSWWYQGNVLLTRAFKSGFRGSARVEFFNDPSALILQNVTTAKMALLGLTAGFGKQFTNSIIRLEARYLNNTTGVKVFPISPSNSFSSSSFSLNLSVVNWF